MFEVLGWVVAVVLLVVLAVRRRAVRDAEAERDRKNDVVSWYQHEIGVVENLRDMQYGYHDAAGELIQELWRFMSPADRKKLQSRVDAYEALTPQEALARARASFAEIERRSDELRDQFAGTDT